MNRIKELREAHKMKQQDLIQMLNVSQGTLSNWERGIHDPDTASLLKLSDIFDTSIDFLLGKADVKNSDATYFKPAPGSSFEKLNQLPEDVQRQIVDYYEYMVIKHLGKTVE